MKKGLLELVFGMVIGGLVFSGISYVGHKNAENIKSNVDKMASTLQVAQETNDQLKNKLGQVEGAANGEVQKANIKIGSLTGSLEEAKKESEANKQFAIFNNSKLQEEELAHSNTKEELNKAHTSIEDLNSKLNQAIECCNRLHAKNLENAAKLVELQRNGRPEDISAIKDKEKTIEELKSQENILQTKINDLQKQIENDNKEDKQTEAKASQDNKKAQSEINRLEGEIKKANDEIKAIDKYVADKAGKVTNEQLKAGVSNLLNYKVPEVK